MVFGLVLGPMMENALRRSLVISNGRLRHFFHPSHIISIYWNLNRVFTLDILM